MKKWEIFLVCVVSVENQVLCLPVICVGDLSVQAVLIERITFAIVVKLVNDRCFFYINFYEGYIQPFLLI